MIFMQSSDGKDFYEIDWEKAQYELQEEIEKSNKIQIEEIEKKKQEEFILKKKEIEEDFENKRNILEDNSKKKLEEIQNQINKIKENEEKKRLEKMQKKEEEKMKEKLNKLNEEENKKKQEYEKYQKNIQLLEESKNKSIEFIKLNEKFENTFKSLLKKISKMKIIINELKREINIEIVIHKNIITNTESNIYIRIENFEEGYVYYWPINTFYNRYDIMKEMFNKFEDGDLDQLDIDSILNTDYASLNLTFKNRKAMFDVMKGWEFTTSEFSDLLSVTEETIYTKDTVSKEKAAMCKCLAGHGVELSVVLEQILLYFIYAYFCGSAYDEFYFGQAQLAVCTCLHIQDLALSHFMRTGDITLDDLIRLTYLYARELEHSIPNILYTEEYMDENPLV